MIRAVIFDIDGTLLDSVDLHAAAWVEAFAQFGVKAKFADVRRHIGEGADRLLPAFLPKGSSEGRTNEIEKFRADLFREKYLPQVRPFAKVRTLFERLKAAGLRVVLGSSCTAEDITRYKQIAGIADLTEWETTSDDAGASKPAPDIFRKALEKLWPLKASDCVVIGDTRYDGEAARKAGMAFIGVLCGGSTEKELRQVGAAAIVRDIEDLLVSWSSPYTTLPAHDRAAAQ
jgi:HAD superfamily hydrolase (TIGR01509 family)